MSKLTTHKNSDNEIAITNSIDDVKISCDINSKSKIKYLWDKQINKIKHGCFTCPLCRESFTGIAALGIHLKDHCT